MLSLAFLHLSNVLFLQSFWGPHLSDMIDFLQIERSHLLHPFQTACVDFYNWILWLGLEIECKLCDAKSWLDFQKPTPFPASPRQHHAIECNVFCRCSGHAQFVGPVAIHVKYTDLFQSFLPIVSRNKNVFESLFIFQQIYQLRRHSGVWENSGWGSKRRLCDLSHP